MKIQLLTAITLLWWCSGFGQVGINTITPSATLDIVAKTQTGTTTTPEGIIVPRVDRQRAQSMTSVPTSTIIYVNNISTGTQTGTAVNIDAVGLYMYNGTAWTKVSSGGNNIYNSDGTLTGNRTVSMGSNNLAFTGSGKVGIGTSSPNISAALEVSASNKGFLPPRVNLVSLNDAVTIPSPATGLTVYHQGANNLNPGLYVNNGTPAIPNWLELAGISNTQGSSIKKIKYEATNPDPTKFVTIGNLDFRINGSNIPEIRMNTAISSNKIFTYHTGQYYQLNGFFYANVSKSFTPANWNTWQDVNYGPGDGMSTVERNQIWLSIEGDEYIYCVDFVILAKGAGVNIYSVIVNRY